MFTVKSAYEFAFIDGGRVSPLSASSWQSLWGLKLQARLKHLLWKIAWNILPSEPTLGVLCFPLRMMLGLALSVRVR
ncbi:hypothetical protein SLA2020_403710 [Shorea laevis]